VAVHTTYLFFEDKKLLWAVGSNAAELLMAEG
jgi:hypothetical protein